MTNAHTTDPNHKGATKVFIDGSVCDGERAKISVFDRGFLYGDSVYEVMRTANGSPVDLERHLDRLSASAASLWLPSPSATAIHSAIDSTLRAAGNSESYIRVILTRGAGEIGLDVSLAGDAQLLVIVKPLVLPPPSLYREGAALQIVGVRRTSREAIDPAVKSGNYLNNILALAEARRHGAHEAVMLSPDGLVAEGSTSNIFAVKNKTITTPAVAVGLLAGITRARVIELAAECGFEVCCATLSPAELRHADEVFITSSIRGLLPIRAVDEYTKEVPGPVTERLLAAYSAFLTCPAQTSQ